MFTEILYKTKLDQVLLMYHITYLYSAGIRSKGGNFKNTELYLPMMS